MKKKTLIITIVSIVVALIAIGLLVYFLAIRNNDKVSKITETYNELSGKENYTFIRKIDDENKITNIKKGDKAYKEEISQGIKSALTYYDGNTYFMNDSIKQYFEYQNNDYIYTEIVNNFLRAKDLEYTEGKEEINGKKYNYEEVSGYQDFLIDPSLYAQDINQAKTRFYYKGDDLKYIKTIIGDKEELLEISIEYTADSGVYEVPSDYTNGETDIQE